MMDSVSKALEDLKAGKTSAEEAGKRIAAVAKPGKPAASTLEEPEREDMPGEFEPGTYDEVHLAFMKHEITDDQYGAIAAAAE